MLGSERLLCHNVNLSVHFNLEAIFCLQVDLVDLGGFLLFYFYVLKNRTEDIRKFNPAMFFTDMIQFWSTTGLNWYIKSNRHLFVTKEIDTLYYVNILLVN